MTIQERITAAENLTSAAVVQWIARSMALRERVGRDLAGTAEVLGAPSGIVDAIKAAVSASDTGSFPDLGGNSAAAVQFAEQTAQTSAFFAMYASGAFQRVPFETSLLSLGADISAALVGEGAPIPLSPLQMDKVTLRRQKAGAIVALTDAVWRDTTRAGQGLVNEALRRSVGRIVDERLFASLLVSGTPEESIYDLDAFAYFVGVAMDHLRTTADARPWFILSPEADNFLVRLAIMNSGLNITQNTLMTFPKVVTDGLQAGQLAVIDARAVIAGLDGIQFRTSRDATLEMLDDPTNDVVTPTPTTQISLFQANATAVRVLVDFGLDLVRQNAMALATIEEAGS